MNNSHIHLSYADCRENACNCIYPHAGTAGSADELRDLVRHDHVFANFKDGRRSIENFLSSSAVPLDCDNDHSDLPEDWIRPEDIPSLFPGVCCAVYSSRNNGKAKGSKSARPRFHVVFPVDEIRNAEVYSRLKAEIAGAFPFFDANALDAARFFFGIENAEVSFYEGDIFIDEFIRSLQAAPAADTAIPEGTRNSELSRRAAAIIKRYGDTPEANEKFREAAALCSPPLNEHELGGIWRSARKFYSRISSAPGYAAPAVFKPVQTVWSEPVPFEEKKLPSFPVNMLPEVLKNYVLAVAESLQTPVDMAAVSALGVLSLCCQGKYVVRINSDWAEPLNLYAVTIAEPSERKSSNIKAMIRPVIEYEAEYNAQNEFAITKSAMMKEGLLQKQHNTELAFAKGKATEEDMEKVAREISEFVEIREMNLFVDDVTPEKLAGRLAAGGGRAAIVSSEGGIFDILSGLYSKSPNIDVFLKAYSGDDIRVDRVGRPAEMVSDPALTVLLMVQPSILAGLMDNRVFRGRGLTARFLYSIPESKIGTRSSVVRTIPEETYADYRALVRRLLADDCCSTEQILLSPEAEELRREFADYLEPQLVGELADLKDWAGKIVGTTMRIAGLLCRAESNALVSSLSDEQLVISVEQMVRAVSIAEYFIAHARAAFALMGADTTVNNCKYVLSAIRRLGKNEIDRRTVMRECRALHTAEAVQTVLDALENYGYIALKDPEAYSGHGRPANPGYLVNPALFEE